MFGALTASEKEKMYDAIPVITILIAGADDEIDVEETDWAAKLTKIRSYSSNTMLQQYYTEIGYGFEGKLKEMIASMPSNKDERQKLLSSKLSALNPVLAKLDAKAGSMLYKDFKSFAEHVARASGGFMRFGTISGEEKRLLPLSMIEPIEYIEEEDA